MGSRKGDARLIDELIGDHCASNHRRQQKGQHYHRLPSINNLLTAEPRITGKTSQWCEATDNRGLITDGIMKKSETQRDTQSSFTFFFFFRFNLSHGQQVDHFWHTAGGTQRRVKELNTHPHPQIHTHTQSFRRMINMSWTWKLLYSGRWNQTPRDIVSLYNLSSGPLCAAPKMHLTV